MCLFNEILLINYFFHYLLIFFVLLRIEHLKFVLIYLFVFFNFFFFFFLVMIMVNEKANTLQLGLNVRYIASWKCYLPIIQMKSEWNDIWLKMLMLYWHLSLALTETTRSGRSVGRILCTTSHSSGTSLVCW